MELSYYCEMLCKYYDLYANESIREVSDHLWSIILCYQKLINSLIEKETF